MNYGESKGATYDRVVIFPTKTIEPFIKLQTDIESKQTKAKFYVACTRARYSVAFAMNTSKLSSVYERVELQFGKNKIPAYRFIGKKNK